MNQTCPIPINDYKEVLLAHGGGGKLSNQLISRMFFPQFKNDLLNPAHDGAVFDIPKGKMAFSTDSFVVQPIFFPGGNIGELAVNGTVNDIACCGAKPLYLSLAFIIEEGFSMEELWNIVQSIKEAAKKANVLIVTGDTKVVDKGKGDKIFINTSGVGLIPENINISPILAKPGDKIIINGRIADHGITIMSKRAGLQFESEIKSDTAPLNGLIQSILDETKNIHVLRDPTRGGIASALNEIADSAQVGIEIDEKSIPISENVRAACELLGLDPLYIANEGKVLIFVPQEEAENVLIKMKEHEFGKESAIIGTVVKSSPGIVRMKTVIGSSRVVDMISGEQLPRIC
ncbi:MAG: hydrogenase expression/formation protein HypE [Bacteroidota bacterium]